MTFSYLDGITIAAHHAFDLDLPLELWPNTIANEAGLLAGLDSDRQGCAGLD